MNKIRDWHFQSAWNEFGTYPGEAIPGTNSKFLNPSVAREASQRQFSDTSLDHASLIVLIKEGFSNDREGRSLVPSAGNIQDVGIHILSMERGELLVPAGKTNQLALVASFEKPLYDRLIYSQISGSPHLFLISAKMDRYVSKYGARAYRFVLLEAGHLGQVLITTAQKMGFASCAIGGFNDYIFSEMIQGELTNSLPLYIIALGRKKATDMSISSPKLK